jgi:hypothetical protein
MSWSGEGFTTSPQATKAADLIGGIKHLPMRLRPAPAAAWTS